MWRIVSILLIFLVVSACNSTSTPTSLLQETVTSLQNEGQPRIARGGSRSLIGPQGGIQGATVEGTGTFVSAKAPTINAGKTRSGENGYTLNLLDAPIKVAAKSVLTDILGVTYTIDPRV